MANHKSALKRIKQNEKRRLRNKRITTALRTRCRQFDVAIEKGDIEGAESAFLNAESSLMRAASKGIIPSARASRKTGRLAARLHSARSGASA